jgi:parvulin-like peptidyl-prolyl isomerase
MRSKMKKFGVLFTAAALAAAVVQADDKPASTNPAGTPKLASLLPDTVIATGKGFELKQSQLDEAMIGVKAQFASQGREVPADKLPLIEKGLLDRLIQIQILKAKATDAQKAEGAKEGDSRFALFKKRAGSDDTFKMQLKSVNLSPETLHARLTEEATAETVLKSKVKVTDEQVQKFYDDNPSQFEVPEQVHVSHILIGTKDPKTDQDLTDDQKKAKKKQIDDLLKRARAGEDFGKLAKEFSEDPGSKDNGGEYTFARASADPRHAMVPEFEAAAFSLQTNQVSDVVTTAYGYHIIKLMEKIPAKKVEFAKVKDDIHSYLETQEIQKMLPAYYKELRKEADVKILDEKLKAVDEAEAAAPSQAAGSPVKVSNDSKPAAK